jgi:hypothetical protein
MKVREPRTEPDMISVRTRILALTFTTAMLALNAAGCPLGCGVAPVAGPNSQSGVVTFDAVVVGDSESLTVPFADTADVAETITGATLEGPDAADFEVLTPFPLPVPAGGSASVRIRFAPSHSGSSSATLVLDTQGMGPSPVDLEGTGLGG